MPLRVLAVLLSLTLVAAACNGDDDGDGDAGDEDTEETEPTDDTAEDGDDGEGDEVEAGADRGNVDGTFRVATVLPLTGDLAPFGPGMQAAVELASEDINEAGGVLGPMELTTLDSGTDPTTAQNAAEGAINDGADFIVGAAGSAVTIGGVLPVLGEGTSVGGCSGSATAPQLSERSEWMRTVPSDIGQAELMASKLAEAGHTRIAVMFRADDYGEAFGNAVVDELEAANIEVVTETAVDPDGTNFNSEIAQVTDTDPDAVVMILFPPEGGQVISGLLESGITTDQLYGGDGLADETLAGSVDPDDPSVVEGMFGTRPGGGGDGGESEFITRLREQKDVEEVTFAETTANCLFIYGLAAHEAESDDAREIRDLLPEVTSGGTECATYAECVELIDAGEDYAYTGAGITLNTNLEPNEGSYEFWTFDAEGAIEGLDTATIAIEA